MDEKCATAVCGTITTADSSDETTPVAARPMSLIVVSGGLPGAMVRLARGTTRVGRSRDSDLPFSDPNVSRRHASILVDSHDDVWITDLNSTNGTYLNGVRLSSGRLHRLDDGARVQFGSSVMVKFVRLDPCDEQFQRTLFERSVRDPLTGLYNRAYFFDQVGPLVEHGASRNLGLAVLMLDVDHFKRINDSYGHDEGDAVLREVAVVLRESTRNEDLVARYGGEEFVIALPASVPDQATERAERIRAALESRRIPLTDQSSTIQVTASIGLAYAHAGRIHSVPALISAADQCLYQAKDAGRNRVFLRVDPRNVQDVETDRVTPKLSRA